MATQVKSPQVDTSIATILGGGKSKVQAGRTTFNGSATSSMTVTINLPTTMPDANYVVVGVIDGTIGPSGGLAIVSVGTRSTTQIVFNFNLSSGTFTAGTNNYAVYWLVIG